MAIASVSWAIILASTNANTATRTSQPAINLIFQQQFTFYMLFTIIYLSIQFALPEAKDLRGQRLRLLEQTERIQRSGSETPAAGRKSGKASYFCFICKNRYKSNIRIRNAIRIYNVKSRQKCQQNCQNYIFVLPEEFRRVLLFLYA